MRIFRLLLVAAGGMAVVAGGAMAVACSSSFQTWWVQRRLAAHPELGVKVGAVSAGWRRVELREWRIVRGGGVLTLPAVEVELPVLKAGLGGAVEIRRLQARGWVLELPAASAAGDATAPGTTAEGLARVRAAFAGVFAGWSSPVDGSLDGVELDGTVVLPAGRGRVRVQVAGGGFRAEQEGKLQVGADAALSDPRVSSVALRATLAGRMSSPREFAALGVKFAATAQGAQFPAGVELAGEVAAARGRERETYTVTLANPTHDILHLGAEYLFGSGKVAGNWKLNMRDADVGPFGLGLTLPQFSAAGEGRFDFELATAGLQVSGNLAATAGGLEVWRRELAALGEVKIQGDFDLAERDGVYAVRRLVAGVATTEPVATVTALQPFEFNLASGALRPTDASRELVGLKLHGLPLAWVRPLLGDIVLTGGNLQGELTGLARAGGIVLRTTRRLTVAQASLGRGSEGWVKGVDVALETSLDYNPHGWQAEIRPLEVRQDGAVQLTINARAGRLRGAAEPWKTTGRLEANLAAVLAHPFAAGRSGLTAGAATVEFAGSLGSTKELYAKVELKQLQGVGQEKSAGLPSLNADVRVDVEAGGKLAFRIPVALEAGTKQSDFTIVGTGALDRGTLGRFEATVSGAQIGVDEVWGLGAALVRPPAGPTEFRSQVPWAGLAGVVTFKFGQVEWSELGKVGPCSGRVEVAPGRLVLDDLQASFDEKGRANLSGVLTHDGSGTQPYQFEGNVALKDFEPAASSHAASTPYRPMLDGRFDLTGQVVSRAASVGELLSGAGGEFRFTSKGGVFRGLPATVNQAVANTGRVAGFIAAAGSALGGLTGRKEPAAVAGRPQAVAEFSAAISAIAFDQLSFGFSRDAVRNGVVRDFALIAPELRLTGGGSVLHRAGTPPGEDSVAMEFKLKARGRQAELLRYLGVLDSVADELGYAACSLPVRLGGTMARPDASDLSTRLAALALDKGSVTEKASELFNRIIGGGK